MANRWGFGLIRNTHTSHHPSFEEERSSMLSDTEKAHIRALGYGETAPSNGFEKHFLRVIRDEGRWACQEEKVWVDYWLSIQVDLGQQRVARTSVEIAQQLNATDKISGEMSAAKLEGEHVSRQSRHQSADSRSGKRINPSASAFDLAVVVTSACHGVHTMEQLKADPLLQKAIELTTHRPIDELAADAVSLQGAINAAKGRYFELLVEEKLNAGEAVGELSLRSGEHFQLASTMTQPGWDGVVLNASGEVVESIQLKATESADYLRETLARYPDIQIVATSEAAERATGPLNGLVLDSGIDDQTLERLVHNAFSAETTADNFLDAFNPLLPLVLIAASEGYTVKLGRKSVEEAFANGLSRGKHSLTGTALGAFCAAIGLGWFSVIPAAWAARKGPDKLLQGAGELCAELRKEIERGKNEYRKASEAAQAHHEEVIRLRLEQYQMRLERTKKFDKRTLGAQLSALIKQHRIR